MGRTSNEAKQRRNNAHYTQNKASVQLSTRQKRRKALVSLIIQLEQICDAEKEYWDNIPIIPQNGEVYQAAEQAVTTMEEALGLLHHAYLYPF